MHIRTRTCSTFAIESGSAASAASVIAIEPAVVSLPAPYTSATFVSAFSYWRASVAASGKARRRQAQKATELSGISRASISSRMAASTTRHSVR